MYRYWYALTNQYADPFVASNYRKMSPGFKPGCSNGWNICAIYSPAGNIYPVSPLSQNLQYYIADALANGVPEPQIPWAAKKYVYLRLYY